MKFDLILRHVWIEKPKLFHGDIGIKNGLIASIKKEINESCYKELDCKDGLASPPFIDPHTHLDKALLKPRENVSGTLKEAINIMEENKSAILDQNFDTRVEKVLRWSISNGTMFIRTHVDVSPSVGIESIKRMKSIKEKWKDLIELQIVAFPQDGLIHQPGVFSLLEESLRNGADLLGGIPAIEKTIEDQRNHIRLIFNLAKKYNVDIDMHIDESDDPFDRTLELLADETIRENYHGRVTAAHCCALASYDDSYANLVIDKVKRANINIISNATVNLVLQGRKDSQPKRRGITRVKELLLKKVNVTCGNDNIRDVFYPFGQADMLEAAFVMALTAQMTGKEELKTVIDMPRYAAAKVLNLQSYGVELGKPANIIILTSNKPDVILSARKSNRVVIRKGRILSNLNVAMN